MPAADLLEASKILGSIVAVWFVVVGWKILPLLDDREPLQSTLPK